MNFVHLFTLYLSEILLIQTTSIKHFFNDVHVNLEQKQSAGPQNKEILQPNFFGQNGGDIVEWVWLQVSKKEGKDSILS